MPLIVNSELQLPVAKKKILFLSDHPLAPSGVGVQARMLIEGLIKTGKFSFICLGGAIKHTDYNSVIVNADFIVKPVDGFGTREQIRNLLMTERPDCIIIFTDPRQFVWLWEIEDEIHQICPIAYWHVWDNDPYPSFNKVWYESTDLINCLSHKTYEMVVKHFPEKTNYIPHSFPKELYFPAPEDQIVEVRKQNFGDKADWFMALWVNRNATRKMPSDLLEAWKIFLDNLEKKEGHRKACMVMHTDPGDPEGPNLLMVSELLGLQGHVLFSNNKLDFQHMNVLHNITDTCVNISKNEGFGLCLGSNTLIQTTMGLKHIKNMEIGDQVFSSDGHAHKVQALSKRTAEATITIKAGKRKPVVSSLEHPFLVSSLSQTRGIRSTEWKTANNLAVGDLLCIRKPIYFQSRISPAKEIDITEWIELKNGINFDSTYIWNKMGFTGKKIGMSIADIQEKFGVGKFIAEHIRFSFLGIKSKKKHNAIKSKRFANILLEEGLTVNSEISKVFKNIKIDADFFTFLGWYLAEGSSSGGNGIEIDLHKKEIEVAKWIKNYVFRTFGISGSTQVYGNKSRFWCSSKILSALMIELCGSGALNKRINQRLYPHLDTYGKYLLRSLFLGDGSHHKCSWGLTTISPLLAQQVSDLLLHYDILSYFADYEACKPGNHRQYKVVVTGLDYFKFCNLVELPLNGKCKQRSITRHQDDKFIYAPIISLVKNSKKEELFDIQVEDSENFMANGIVAHNSTVISLQCGKPILALKTGGLTRQVVDYRDGYEYGAAIEPVTRKLVGSQMVPWIYEDYADQKDVAAGFMKIYSMTSEEKRVLKQKALEYVDAEFGYENMIGEWSRTLLATIGNWKDLHSSWSLTSLDANLVFEKPSQPKQVAQKQVVPANLLPTDHPFRKIHPTILQRVGGKGTK